VRKKIKIGFFILSFIAACVSVYLYQVYKNTTVAMEDMYVPLKKDEEKEKEMKEKMQGMEKESVTFLILGVDERPGDKGRSDTIVVVSVNPSTNETVMMSIPRDTRVSIPGYKTTKINHAYGYGIDTLVETVEDFLDLPIDYFVKVNMQGFEGIVDAVGGVTVQNGFTFEFTDEDGRFYSFPKGELTLNGKEALAYARMRKHDPRGDFGRNERQRQIIHAVIQKGTSPKIIATYQEILLSIGQNVETNITIDAVRLLLNGYKDSIESVQSIELSGSGQMIGGGYYFVVSEEEKNRIRDVLEKHREAKPSVE
jgi:polyisoprenyl-teichoic acid--peptidoglycan teichoic acid transferase